MESGTGKPLALAFTLLGYNSESVWPVLPSIFGQLSLLAICGWLTLTCHHLEVVKLGKRKAGQVRSIKPFNQLVTARLEVMEQCSLPPSLTLPTDNHRPPTPTVVAEALCGEWCREAFGTCVCIAGS